MPADALIISACTLVNALGRGTRACFDALEEARGGLRPCDFDDVDIDVAILRLTGELLSLFHLVSLLLVVGISIDYGLFFSRGDTDAGMRGRTFHGLMVCMLSTVSVFGILATSRLHPCRCHHRRGNPAVDG